MERSSTNVAAVGFFSQFGLLVVVGLGTLAVLALTVLLPPWFRVEAQRRKILYWSEQVKVYNRTFAGYDFLLADEKWRRTGPTNPPSEAYFDVTEYQVAWPLLWAEWIALLLGGTFLFFRWSRRIRVRVDSAGPSVVAHRAAPNQGDKEAGGAPAYGLLWNGSGV